LALPISKPQRGHWLKRLNLLLKLSFGSISPRGLLKCHQCNYQKSFSHDNRYSALNTENEAQNNGNDLDNGSNYELNNNIKFKNVTERKNKPKEY